MFLKKYVALYVVALVAVVLFTKLVGPRISPPSTDESAGFVEPMLTQFLPMLVLFVVFVTLLSKGRKHLAVVTEAERLLQQGRNAQARELFQQYRQQNPKHAFGAIKLGIAHSRLWRLKEALDELQAGKALGAGDLAAVAFEHEALVKAVLGDVAGARAALQAVPAGRGDPRYATLIAAVLEVRSGDFAGARSRLGSFDAKQLPGVLGAFVRALEAWSIEALTGELRHVDRVALFGETGPEALRAAWPEFVAFVERAPLS